MGLVSAPGDEAHFNIELRKVRLEHFVSTRAGGNDVPAVGDRKDEVRIRGVNSDSLDLFFGK